MEVAMREMLLESADVARLLNLTPSGVRRLADLGQLRPTAVTPRGGRLYRQEDVNALRRARGARQAKAQRR
jgi:DNA-binding transcriptional MerR regulator